MTKTGRRHHGQLALHAPLVVCMAMAGLNGAAPPVTLAENGPLAKTSVQQQGTKMSSSSPERTTFLYLVQCSKERGTAELEGEDSAVLQLVFGHGARPVRNTTFVLRNSSWNEGRNALLARAKATYHRELPLYLIFMDCDAQLVEVRDFGRNTGQPYRTFESYLLRYLPAVGHAHFDWQPYDEDKEIISGVGNYDAIVNAFHRDAVDALLPYATHWDRHSWHYSQLVVHTMTSALFPNRRLQFNALRVQQRAGHASYPRGAMWEVPFLWILPLFRSRKHVRILPVHHINLEQQPVVKSAALIRNVNPLLAVVSRLPRPSSLPCPLSARLPSISRLIDQILPATPPAVNEGDLNTFISTPSKLSMEPEGAREFNLRHPYWRHRIDDGSIAPCRDHNAGEEDVMRGRGTGPWVNWGEYNGGTAEQGGGGGQAGTEPGQDWLRGVPLLLSEKEALRAAYMGGAAVQDWLCPPMRVPFSIYDTERQINSSDSNGETLSAGRRDMLVHCVSHTPSRWDCWHDLALESIKTGQSGVDGSGDATGRGAKQVALESTAMLRTAFRLLGGWSRKAACEYMHSQGQNMSSDRSENRARASVSQHLSLVLDELGAKYGALFHAALAATSGGNCEHDQEDEVSRRSRANRWLNLASICKDMCLYRCAMEALDAYLSSSCSAVRCKGSHIRTASVESWVLLQRAGALGSLRSAGTYGIRFQLLNLSIKYLTSSCRSRPAQHGHRVGNGGVQGDVPVIDAADVLAMPLDLDVMDEFARCEAEKVLASVNLSTPAVSVHQTPFTNFFNVNMGRSAFAVRGARGLVRVGYITVIDACRVHNSMFRALFDAEVVGHRTVQAFTFVWDTHMIEKRAGYASPAACARASGSAVEVSPGMSVQEVAEMVNSHGIHVLVDFWGWAPLGRSVRSLDILSLRPSAVTAVMLGSLNSPSGGLVDFVISDRIVLPPEYSHSFGREHGYSERWGFLPASFVPNSHNPFMPVARWARADADMGSEHIEEHREKMFGVQREDVRGAHGWPRGETRVVNSAAGGNGGVVMMAGAQLFALDPLLCDIWLQLLRDVPDLVLALTANAYAFLGMQSIAKRAKDLHVPEERIKWHQRILEDEAYVQRLSAADIILDTTWHNSLGAVLDGLWAATPVVSLASERPSSRVAASLMIAADAPLALARNLDDYQALVTALVRLAQSAKQLLRRRLALARLSNLFNSSLWVARWEIWLCSVVDLTFHTQSLGGRPFHLIASDIS